MGDPIKMEETWIKLTETDNRYSVSNLGRIKDNLRHEIVKQFKDKDGYFCVGIHTRYGRKKMFVHRIVASIFVQNITGRTYVNHINHDPGFNFSGNLEWVTSSENARHCHDNGRGAGFTKVPNNKMCIQVSLDGFIIGVYKSQLEAKKLTGINNAAISLCMNGRMKTAGGYIWM